MTLLQNKNVRLALIIAALVCLWLLLGVLRSDDDKNETVTAQDMLPYVAVSEGMLEAHTPILTLSTVLEPREKITLTARRSGIIADVHRDRGAAIKVGDVLAQFENTAELKALRAAESKVVESESLFEAARRLNRQGYRANTSLEGERANLDSARQMLSEASRAVSETLFIAPFDGFIQERFVSSGQALGMGENGFDLVENGFYKAESYVPQKQRSFVRMDQQASVELINGTRLNGKVTYIAPEADETTRTFEIHVEVMSDQVLPVGMSGDILLYGEPVQAQKVPYSALVLSDAGAVGVMAVDASDTALFIPVQAVDETRDGFYIRDGRRIITRGQYAVSPGQQVTTQLEQTP